MKNRIFSKYLTEAKKVDYKDNDNKVGTET